MFYLNNAGAGLMKNTTLDAIMDYYKYEQVVGAYQAASDLKENILAFYSNVSKLINAENTEDIAFVDSASRGWNLAVYGTGLTKGDDIITLSSEFGTNLITLYDLAFKTGANIHIIPCKIDGSFSVATLESILATSKGKKLVAISHAAAQGSIVNPVAEIGQLSKKYGAMYIVDGCQSVGQMKVDVQDMNCDAFVASGRKWLCGPRGTGFLYVRKNCRIAPTQLDLASADLIIDKNQFVTGLKIRSDARRFEIWERNIASVVGLSAAISDTMNHGIQRISDDLLPKAELIRNAVTANAKLQLVGQEHSISGIIGFYAKNPNDEIVVKEKLQEANINTSAMSDYDCPLFFPQNGASSIFRISPHYYTESDAIETVCSVIKNI